MTGNSLLPPICGVPLEGVLACFWPFLALSATKKSIKRVMNVSLQMCKPHFTFITLFTFRGGPSTPVLSRFFFRLPDPFHSLFRYQKQGVHHFTCPGACCYFAGRVRFPDFMDPDPDPDPHPDFTDPGTGAGRPDIFLGKCLNLRVPTPNFVHR